MPQILALGLVALLACSDSHQAGNVDSGRVAVPADCMPELDLCNGSDDDCDGLVDEWREGICSSGEVCTDGECVCASGNRCDGRCVDTHSDNLHCGGCGVTCPVGTGCIDGSCCEVQSGELDLLLVIDSSGSMSEEQANFSAGLPWMIEALLTGDLDDDGRVDVPPVESLHTGVITTDMGTAGHSIPTCADADFGDDGILRTNGNTAYSGCEPSYAHFLAFQVDGETTPAELGCVANVGTAGCGFEQPLEAALKAVTPSSSGLEFFMQTRGHADTINGGFVRPDAMLGVIVVSDEDDCSLRDPDLVNPASTRHRGDLNLRCSNYPDSLQPVERYVSGLLALKADPSDVAFFAMTGVPERLHSGHLDEVLADSDLQQIVDPLMPTRLRPSCNRPGTGLAFPPRRLVETAQGIADRGGRGAVASICVDDLRDGMRRAIETFRGASMTCRD